VGWALGISIVFALYFTFFEIGQQMGKGALSKLFFEPRESTTVPGTSRTSALPLDDVGNKSGGLM